MEKAYLQRIKINADRKAKKRSRYDKNKEAINAK